MYKLLLALLLLFTVHISAQKAVWEDYWTDQTGVEKNDITLSSGLWIISQTDTIRKQYYSKPIWFSDDDGTNAFSGLWGVILKVDKAGTDTVGGPGIAEVDSLRFWPEYWGGPSIGWIAGDTMQFHQRTGAFRTGGYIDTLTWIVDTTAHNTLYYWQSTPTDSFNLDAFPFQRGRVGMETYGDSTNFGLYMDYWFDRK